MNLTEEFTALVESLQAANVEFAVCGGMAMALHGQPRFTNDVDFLIQAADLPIAVDAATQCGFDDNVESLKLGQQTGRIVEIQRVNKFRGEDFLTLDYVLVGPVLKDVWRGRMTFQWRDRSLQIGSAPGLRKIRLIRRGP